MSKMTKKELEKALELACRKMACAMRCEECIWPKNCEGRVDTSCAKTLKAHFLALAKEKKS